MYVYEIKKYIMVIFMNIMKLTNVSISVKVLKYHTSLVIINSFRKHNSKQNNFVKGKSLMSFIFFSIKFETVNILSRLILENDYYRHLDEEAAEKVQSVLISFNLELM